MCLKGQKNNFRVRKTNLMTQRKGRRGLILKQGYSGRRLVRLMFFFLQQRFAVNSESRVMFFFFFANTPSRVMKSEPFQWTVEQEYSEKFYPMH